MIWIQMHPRATSDHLGLIPDFFEAGDNRSAVEQVNERYCDAWHDTLGFTLKNGELHYPGDPALKALWATVLERVEPDEARALSEMVIVYEHAFVAVIDLTDKNPVRVARLD